MRQAQRVLEGTLDDGQSVEFMLFSTALNNADAALRQYLA